MYWVAGMAYIGKNTLSMVWFGLVSSSLIHNNELHSLN